MGNGYNSRHHLYHHHEKFQLPKKMFLPMLCRLCTTDVKLIKDPSNSTSFSHEPSSPKVTCIGQVKRNNRIIGFPTPITATATAAAAKTSIVSGRGGGNSHLKYTKLKRLFSSKSFSSSSSTSAAAGATVSGDSCILKSQNNRGNNIACRSRRVSDDRGEGRIRRVARSDHDHNDHRLRVVVDISQLDPPLPVVKRVVQQKPCGGDGGGGGREEVNLWKRRGGGVALKSLQLQHIVLPKNTSLLPPTV